MLQDKTVVLCMLWGNWGGQFGLEYVLRLRNMVARHTNIPHDFYCLTDRIMPENEHGIHWLTIPEYVLRWPRNLPKFFMHKVREEWKGRQIMFFDLDTVIVNNIDDFMSYRGQFATLNPFNPKNNHKSTPGGVMSFQHGYSEFMWQALEKNPNYWMRMSQGGKERIVMNELEGRYKWDRWQDLFPGQLVSYKKHVRRHPTFPQDARIIAFHGTPRPHEALDNKIVKHFWK